MGIYKRGNTMKDYAKRDWIKFILAEEEKRENDWEEVGKEDYLRILKYMLFAGAAWGCGYVFLAGLLA